MRISVREFFVQAYPIHQPSYLVFSLAARHAAFDIQWLSDACSDQHSWVARCIWVLADHLVVAAMVSEIARPEFIGIAAVMAYRSTRWVLYTHKDAPHRRLPGAGFSHDPDRKRVVVG